MERDWLKVVVCSREYSIIILSAIIQDKYGAAAESAAIAGAVRCGSAGGDYPIILTDSVKTGEMGSVV